MSEPNPHRPSTRTPARASGVFWLASYPKSGNTWMRALLANYLADADEPVDINALGGGPIASARGLFDDHVGVEASDLTQDEIERYRGRVYERFAAEHDDGDPPLFCKVHDAWTLGPDGEPLFSERSTAGVIYLIRNPLDVAVSFAHHSASTVERMVNAMLDPDYCFVGRDDRLHNQLRQRLLTWAGHAESWVDRSRLPVLVVRYEDTKADPVASFTRVIEFAGLDPNPERIRKAVEFSRFDRLKALEQEQGFGEKMPKSASFFRKGQVGSWSDELPVELAEKLCDAFEETMQRFGYERPDFTSFERATSR